VRGRSTQLGRGLDQGCGVNADTRVNAGRARLRPARASVGGDRSGAPFGLVSNQLAGPGTLSDV
jgi:hypothetical protein